MSSSHGSALRLGVPLAVALLLAGALALTAGADAPEKSAPILHQDLRPPGAPATAGGAEQRNPAVFGAAREAKNPSAIASGEKILPEPSTGDEANADEPVHGEKGFAADRMTDWKPDYHTEEDGTLRYVEVFNPSIVPFKRMTSLDAVDADYRLYTESSTLIDLAVGGEAVEEEDLFWASLVVELRPGVDVPIPSVSPTMRILSYEIEPATRVKFSKDRGDNFYVRSDEAGSFGQHRLVFLAAAPKSYFAPRVPRDLRVSDVPSGQVQPLPPAVRATADRVLESLGVTRRMRLDIALDKLVAYFRAFEPRPPPPSSGDIYWDLYRAQTGVCRHRAFAFMITANALGLPARFVANEAHAWVEVWAPGQDWMRIDLGGAALTLEVKNAGDKSMYRPPGEDPFPKPPSYEENYTRLEGDVEGLSSEQIAEAQTPREGGEGGGGTIEGVEGGEAEGEGEEAMEEEESAGIMTGPGRSRPEIPEEELAGKTPTRIEVAGASGEGFRGETISVEGKLTDTGGAGLEGQRIDLWLAPAGLDGEEAVLVGHTATHEDGTFRADVVLPKDLPLRDYEVFASTPGDSKHQPSLSR